MKNYEGGDVMSFTQEQIDEYIEKGGLACPYCDSINIETVNLDHGVSLIEETDECQVCGRTWTDLYTLTGLKETDE
jgi:transposase-like protein